MLEQNKLQGSQRIKFIDTAKAFGICFVVLGHCVLPQNALVYIYSFHMPLFFVLSGLTFKLEKAGTFFKKKAFSLLLPYFLFCFAYFFKDAAMQTVTHSLDKIALLKELSGIFLCIQKSEYIVHGMWFLPCLFVTELIFYLIVKYVKKSGFVLPAALVLCIFQYVMDRVFNYSLPWSADVALIAVVFMAFGYVFRDKLKQVTEKAAEKKPVYLILAVVMIALGYALAMVNYNISERYVQFSNGFYGELGLMLISALLSAMAVTILSQLVSTGLSDFIGKNSLFIYAFHYFLFIGNIDKKLTDFASGYMNEISAQVVSALVFMTAAIAVCLVLSLVYNKIMNLIKSKIFK